MTTEAQHMQQDPSQAPPVVAPLALVTIAGQVGQYHQGLLTSARQAVVTLHAKAVDLRAGLLAAEEAEEGNQCHRYKLRLARLKREVTKAQTMVEVLEAGYVPMPRLPAVRLEFVQGLMPPDVLLSLADAKAQGFFEEFRVVDGQNAWPSGYPRGWSDRRPAGSAKIDPILVGMVGREMFPIAWWR